MFLGTVGGVELTSGTVLLHTDVTGPAARMGHRLVIGVQEWSASVSVRRRVPVAVSFRAELDSLQVASGAGGLTPLTPVDKQLILRNAARTLDSRGHPQASFVSESVEAMPEGYRVGGRLTIRGVSQSLVADVTVSEGRARTTVPVRQSDFGIKPYSHMLGQLKVVDEVIVAVDVAVPGL